MMEKCACHETTEQIRAEKSLVTKCHIIKEKTVAILDVKINLAKVSSVFRLPSSVFRLELVIALVTYWKNF
jgi:hypothetical protein